MDEHRSPDLAFRPGFINPTLAAQRAQTFQRISGGRL